MGDVMLVSGSVDFLEGNKINGHFAGGFISFLGFLDVGFLGP